MADTAQTEGAPGEIIPGDGPVSLNPDKYRITLVVTNIADRPVQVGSHFHFAATNSGLEFDRAAAWGRHLNIPAGTSVRFEPGVEREVSLVPFGGARVVPGLRVEFAGALDERDHEPRSVPYGGEARFADVARGVDARTADAPRGAEASSTGAAHGRTA